MCPRCRGLLVFGDENSTMTVLPVGACCPKSSVEAMPENTAFQYAVEKDMFRKPFTTLYDAISAKFSFIYAPIAFPVASGLVLDTFRSGKTTRV